MKKIAILTGAGVSKESGLSTFRDADGLWENERVQDVADIHGWYRNPEKVINFYNKLRTGLKNHNPNKAHKIIAELEKNFEVTVITQNVDNLHEKAGSTNVIHLHGELTKVRGENIIYDMPNVKGIKDIGYSEIHIGDKSDQGYQLRPHIVWFGEAVPNLTIAARAVNEADIMLVVGTSLVVYPAAGLINYVKKGTPIYLVDPTPINIHYSPYTQIKDVATKGMEAFEKMILNE